MFILGPVTSRDTRVRSALEEQGGESLGLFHSSTRLDWESQVVSEDCWCPGQDAERTSPEYKSESLRLQPIAQSHNL
jgi:hypothetical protein